MEQKGARLTRPRFSERFGAVKVDIQVTSMNDALKNSIWNFIRAVLPDPEHLGPGPLSKSVEAIAIRVLRRPIDEIRRDYPSAPRNWLFERYNELGWAEVYDLLEFILQNAKDISGGTLAKIDDGTLVNAANHFLAREHSGYRFVAGELTQLTTATEIAEIERAVDSAAAVGLDGVRKHITHALNLFGKRPDPDFRNAVKEAISAVESIVRVINGKRGGDLRDALEAVSTRIELHPALEAGLAKLYAYTSDKDVVRHSIYGDDSVPVDDADARFMMVTCSAFVNFLISKAEAAGLLKTT